MHLHATEPRDDLWRSHRLWRVSQETVLLVISIQLLSHMWENQSSFLACIKVPVEVNSVCGMLLWRDVWFSPFGNTSPLQRRASGSWRCYETIRWMIVYQTCILSSLSSFIYHLSAPLFGSSIRDVPPIGSGGCVSLLSLSALVRFGREECSHFRAHEDTFRTLENSFSGQKLC